MNVHLLPEQLVAVTQKLDELWKLDNLVLLRLLLLLLLLLLPRLLLFLLLLWGGWLCHKTPPRKGRKFGESSAQDWRKFTLPHLTPSPL